MGAILIKNATFSYFDAVLEEKKGCMGLSGDVG